MWSGLTIVFSLFVHRPSRDSQLPDQDSQRSSVCGKGMVQYCPVTKNNNHNRVSQFTMGKSDV